MIDLDKLEKEFAAPMGEGRAVSEAKPWLDATTPERAYCAAGDYFHDHPNLKNREAFIASAIAEWERKRIIAKLRDALASCGHYTLASYALMKVANELENET